MVTITSYLSVCSIAHHYKGAIFRGCLLILSVKTVLFKIILNLNISTMSATSQHAFCLKLNSHQSHVTEAFRKLYNDEVLVDCTLSCSGGTVKAHKLVLSACSPYFTTLFSTFTNPYQYPVVILKDMAFADLKFILEYMYRGEVTVPQPNLTTVLEAAKSLSVTGLCDIKVDLELKTDATSAKTPGTTKRRNKRKRTNSKTDGQEDANGQSDSSEDLEPLPSEKVVTDVDIDDAADDDAKTFVPMDEFEDSSTNSKEPEKVPEPAVTTPASHNLRSSSGPKITPAFKANLRQQRIEKLQAQTGVVSGGRKMWSEEETKALVRVWEEESGRVWASAGKKTLSLQKISDLLQEQDIDRDISQVEGKIKALKRDYKAVKSEKAIASVQARMAPYIDTLDVIYSRDES
ncbi:Protein bric-a-brac 2 [Halotydeus destructor]|nr:Protein bric-a-brac 2 [Halotydeus destructor]